MEPLVDANKPKLRQSESAMYLFVRLSFEWYPSYKSSIDPAPSKSTSMNSRLQDLQDIARTTRRLSP
jgi:hypothetical protein